MSSSCVSLRLAALVYIGLIPLVGCSAKRASPEILLRKHGLTTTEVPPETKGMWRMGYFAGNPLTYQVVFDPNQPIEVEALKGTRSELFRLQQEQAKDRWTITPTIIGLNEGQSEWETFYQQDTINRLLNGWGYVTGAWRTFESGRIRAAHIQIIPEFDPNLHILFQATANYDHLVNLAPHRDVKVTINNREYPLKYLEYIRVSGSYPNSLVVDAGPKPATPALLELVSQAAAHINAALEPHVTPDTYDVKK